jgi:hypothetical protein
LEQIAEGVAHGFRLTALHRVTMTVATPTAEAVLGE